MVYWSIWPYFADSFTSASPKPFISVDGWITFSGLSLINPSLGFSEFSGFSKASSVADSGLVSTGSVVDLVLRLKKKVSKEEINKLFEENQNETIRITYDPIVSSDVIGRRCGSLVDALSTSVLDTESGQLVKVVSWYDNEMSYTAQMVRTAKYLMTK